jgi:lysophospholipase L1-like esterase
MHRKLIVWILALVLFIPALLAAQAPAAQGGPPRGAGGPPSPANQPLPRDDARHKGFLEIAKAGNIDLLFVGDSITDWFANPRGGNPATGRNVWDASFGSMKPANFGIAGDTTQGVLWRMQNGELEGFKSKLIVDGDRLIVEEFKKRQPQAKVLVLGVFPRNNNRQPDQTPAIRATIQEINSKLAKLADNKQVFYMDIGGKFLTSDGTLTTEVMPDGLHPSEKGYQIWADAILPRVKELMK